jgi:hypothetical protein
MQHEMCVKWTSHVVFMLVVSVVVRACSTEFPVGQVDRYALIVHDVSV